MCCPCTANCFSSSLSSSAQWPATPCAVASLTRGIVVQVPSKSYSHFISMRQRTSLFVLHTATPDGHLHPVLAPAPCTSVMDLVGVADVISPAQPPHHCVPVVVVLHAHAQATPSPPCAVAPLTRGIVVHVSAKSYSCFIIMRHHTSLLVLHTVAPDDRRHPALAPAQCTSAMDLVGVADVVTPAKPPRRCVPIAVFV